MSNQNKHVMRRGYSWLLPLEIAILSVLFVFAVDTRAEDTTDELFSIYPAPAEPYADGYTQLRMTGEQLFDSQGGLIPESTIFTPIDFIFLASSYESGILSQERLQI